MSSSPSGTVPATSSDSKSGGCNADVNQTTCLAGPPTFRRAMILATLVGRKSGMMYSGLNLIGSGFRDEIRSTQQAFERSGIGPPAFELFPRHRIARDVGVVDVGDLELAAAGRLQRANDVVDVFVVHVNSDHRVFRLRLRRFLIDPHNAAAIETRHSKPLRIGDLLQNYLRAAVLSFISINGRADVPLNDVVAKHHANWTTGREVFDE